MHRRAEMKETAPGTVGALLIHGLGGTEYDLGVMSKTLKRAGIDTHGITLPGHGSEPADLLDVRAEDWIDAAAAKYRELVARYGTLHVIGMCMGALVAIEVCRRERHDGDKGRLVALAPPVYIDGWATPWYSALRHLMYWLPWASARMKVEEEEPFGIKNTVIRAIVKAKFERGERFHYPWVPLACIRQVDRLRRWVMRGAAAVRCPTLIVHAREDELTSLRSAQFLKARIAQSDMVVLENSYHMICIDNDRARTAESVQRFFGIEPVGLRAGRRASAPEADDTVALTVVRRLLEAAVRQDFDTVFSLFAPDIVWRHHGDNPLAGTYATAAEVVELLTRLMNYSSGTFRVTSFDAPVLRPMQADNNGEGRDVEVTLQFRAASGVHTLQGQGRQIVRVRQDKLVAVDYHADAPADEDAFWRAAARHAGDAGFSSREL